MLFGNSVTGLAASGLFPKTPPATNVYCFNTSRDTPEAIFTAWTLQGLVNRSLAQVYISDEPRYLEQLKDCGKPFDIVKSLPGTNGGLRSIFGKFQKSVKKLFLYDSEKDWSWYLAVMASAQQDGIPVTESLKNSLMSEFHWSGAIEDYRNRWPDRIAAYEWALVNLMPQCNKKVIFALKPGRLLALYDYAVSSGGFVFWLDAKREGDEIEKIFATKGYGVGTSLMGYASGGDFANEVANKYGIGYVVSDFYANSSFWSSFPNKTYSQPLGQAVAAHRGKVYVSFMWSDGDNIAFDQNPLYDFWHDPARGTFPMATPLSPTLQELNPSLLAWYYSKKTDKDELIAGPTGFQFIYIGSFNEKLFPDWCALTKSWCEGAGFHSARIWRCPNPSEKYNTYMTACRFDGVIGEGWAVKHGQPPKIDSFGVSSEENVFVALSQTRPDPKVAVFINLTCVVADFNKKDGGYSAIKRQLDRAQKAYPGRFVFLLPKDQFATIRSYYRLR
jgi:hypothetical protein